MPFTERGRTFVRLNPGARLTITFTRLEEGSAYHIALYCYFPRISE